MRAPVPAGGQGVIRASWWGTAAFTVTAVAAALSPSWFAPVALVVAAGLFLAGILAFLWAYAKVVGRSRAEVIGVGGVYFLAGDTAPASVRRQLLGSLVTEVVVALATAVARPYTSLAAGTLVPLYGLALCGVWAARHGRFPPRDPTGPIP